MSKLIFMELETDDQETLDRALKLISQAGAKDSTLVVNGQLHQPVHEPKRSAPTVAHTPVEADDEEEPEEDDRHDEPLASSSKTRGQQDLEKVMALLPNPGDSVQLRDHFDKDSMNRLYQVFHKACPPDLTYARGVVTRAAPPATLDRSARAKMSELHQQVRAELLNILTKPGLKLVIEMSPQFTTRVERRCLRELATLDPEHFRLEEGGTRICRLK